MQAPPGEAWRACVALAEVETQLAWRLLGTRACDGIPSECTTAMSSALVMQNPPQIKSTCLHTRWAQPALMPCTNTTCRMKCAGQAATTTPHLLLTPQQRQGHDHPDQLNSCAEAAGFAVPMQTCGLSVNQ